MRLVLLAAVLCLAVPATAQATYRDFRSPSGKVGCAFSSDAEVPPMVRCDWQGADDEAIVLRETGHARIRPVTDTVMNLKARRLRYGRSTSFGRLKCISRRTVGITCRSLESGRGFRVSVRKRELF